MTGATSGIGEALARHYASQGASLGLFARREPELHRLAGALSPADVLSYAGDVRDLGALSRAAKDFIDRVGVPDIVIGNAGVSRGTLTQFAEDVAVFRTILDTNVMGLVHTFQPFLPSMLDAKRGTMVGIASLAGVRGIPGSGAYSASKAAAIGYLESLRVELRSSGVAVVTICPGYIATPMTEKNPYAMPFLTASDKAARLIARAIDRRKSLYIVPWQMAIVARVLRVLPNWLFDRVFERAGRKPRQLDGGV
ncbi:MAG TPA: SDR family oxidoreductase [Casimicrobiaceae bacterium]|nr:SDR family oxidoreductase [Casimicrobiaceae bacterium]